MKISLSDNQWFDGEGKPLSAGRVSVFRHDSDIRATIYTLEGDNYVQAQNPVILGDEGRCPTIWFEAATVDVRVEAYNGVPGSYSLVDTYSDGFDMPGVTNDTVVYGIQGLRSANPDLVTVTVVGFDNAHDCGQRCFVWDPECTAQADGCAIVSSAGTQDGRWILLSDSRYMPSSWYGIVPGTNEANLSAFITYPSTVGQWNIKLPPVPRFMAGNYTSVGTFSTTRVLAFDPGASFGSASFSCRSAEISGAAGRVADFQFVEQDVAHSSWFNTVKAFWTCGAKELVEDAVNTFTNSVLGNNVTVANARISGKAITMTGNGLLTLDRCVPAPGTLSTSWHVKFKGMTFSDLWFADADWDFGTWPTHRTWCDSSENDVRISNFGSPDVFELLVASAPNSWTVLDLEGRGVQLVASWMPFTTFRNGTIGKLTLSHGADLVDVTVNDLEMDSWTAAFTFTGCRVSVTKALAASVYMKDTRAWFSAQVNTANTSFDAEGCTLDLTAGSLTRSSTYSKGGGINLRGTRCTGGTVDGAVITVQDCILDGTSVRLVPYMEASAYHIAGIFERNTFVGACALSIVPSLDGTSGASVYDCLVEIMTVAGNSFMTTLPYGVYMPFWAQDMQHRFISGCVSSIQWSGNFDTTWGRAFHYRGNTGNCPAAFGTMTVPGSMGSTKVFTADFTPDGGWELSAWTGTPTMDVFCLPVTPSDYGVDSGGTWTIGDRAKAVSPYKAAAVGGPNGIFPLPFHMYVPLCAIDPSQPNYMFAVLLMADETYNGMGVMPVAGEA